MSEPVRIEPLTLAGPVPASPAPFEAPRLSRPVQLAVASLILLVAFGALRSFYKRGLTDLYGDAIAHMASARRLTDSVTPGYDEIGAVWLPLDHLLVAPLAINNRLWRTGLAGSLVSALALAITAWFVFRLGLAMNGNLAAACLALAGFLACPNMLYVASTPLTEALSMMWLVLTVWGLYRFQQDGGILKLVGAAAAAFFGTLTRYDGWFLLPFYAIFVLFGRRQPWSRRWRDAVLFSVIAGAGPALWILYNLHRYGNPLDFYNGPFSAQAIYTHQLATTGFRYPTDGSYLLSIRYYLEDMKLVIGSGSLVLALLGLAAWVVDASRRARRAAALLLMVPLAFYTQALDRAGTGLYVPTLFPHTYWNLRFGLEMLPAAAVFPSFLLSPRLPSTGRWLLVAVMAAVLAVQFGTTAGPGADGLATVKESLMNSPCRSPLQVQLTQFFKRAYAGGIILMAVGKYPCVMAALGIPYRRTISQPNRRYWNAVHLGPAHWPAGSPLESLVWIVRSQGDAVDEMMGSYPDAFRDFLAVEDWQFAGKDRVRVYRRKIGQEPVGSRNRTGSGAY
jgi:Dolichyl-phosphate-mannose-protein mannosyltransferase